MLRRNACFRGCKSDRRNLLHGVATLVLVAAAPITALCWCKTVTANENERVPNIVVILADDLGYGDLSCYGAEAVTTPNIDALAERGLRFTSGYCSASTCTPTRFSLLTGTYAFRHPRTGIAPPNAPAIIEPGTETVASLLQKAGYKTAVIGKWHLGLGKQEPDWNGDLNPGPLEIGFDHCFLLPTTNDRVPSVYVEDHKVVNLDPKDPLWVGRAKPSPDHPTGITERDKLNMDWAYGHNNSVHNGIGRIGFFTGGKDALWRDEDLADKWVEKSNAWMEKHKDEPFFLFFSSHDIHVPRMPHERFQGKTTLGYRGDAIVQLDWCVGELVKKLKELKIDDNTLIIFCSDNGPVLNDGYKDGAVEKLGDHKPAGPYKGGKYSVWEGGTRTPFIARWPARIKTGVSDKMICTVDLAATLADLVKVDLPKDACIDSFALTETLLGDDDAKGREYLIQQDNGRGNNFGLRIGDWKLVQSGKGNKLALYDLAKDPGETNDLSKRQPEKLKELKAKLDEVVKGDGSRPQE
jgi:arylsulfatase A-like enzyme